jgi:hypothetical protein
VRLYNPWHTSDADRHLTVKTRGHLLWDGRMNAVLNTLTIARGNARFAVSTPQHGTVTHSKRTITYTPNPGFTGTDTFTYMINSSGVVAATAHASTTGTVVVTVANAGTAVYLPLIQR